MEIAKGSTVIANNPRSKFLRHGVGYQVQWTSAEGTHIAVKDDRGRTNGYHADNFLLPKPMENERRICAAYFALKTNSKVRQTDPPLLDAYGSVVDLLTNIRHWAKAHKVSFKDAVRMSREHYQAERS